MHFVASNITNTILQLKLSLMYPIKLRLQILHPTLWMSPSRSQDRGYSQIQYIDQITCNLNFKDNNNRKARSKQLNSRQRGLIDLIKDHNKSNYESIVHMRVNWHHELVFSQHQTSNTAFLVHLQAYHIYHQLL